MKIFMWVHDRTFHSWSMMNEPSLHEAMYSRAAAIVAAETEEAAIEMLLQKDCGWREEDLKRYRPKIMEITEAAIIYNHIQ